MKKFLYFILAVFMLLSILQVTAFAKDADTVVSESIEYLEDGSYMVTILEVEEACVTRATVLKTGSKTTIIYNADDEAMVTMKLTATFSYTGTSATCTNVSPTFTVHNANWRVTKSTGSISGNKGIGDFTAKHYFLGIPTQTRDVTITITCSNTGVLS